MSGTIGDQLANISHAQPVVQFRVTEHSTSIWEVSTMRRRLTVFSAIAATAAFALSACTPSVTEGTVSSGEGYQIGITQITSHPALDSARDGFKEAFSEAGVEVSFDEQNAQGDQATATAIASKFATANLDLVLAIATPSAQSLAQVIADTPVLFTAVTDPVAAQLVTSMEAPGTNITGTTDMNPVKEQLELVKKLVPTATKVGIVYSSGEVNSEVQVAAAKKEAAALGLEIVESTVTNSAEVQQATQALGAVDAIYVPTDNTVVSALASVLQVAIDMKIPVIGAEADTVRNGAIATLGIDYFALGKQTGEMALRVLKDGANPATMPVEQQKTYSLIVNKKAAVECGLTLPADFVSSADEVIE